MINQKIAAVFGATGFVGRHIVRELAQAGYTVRAITRNAQKAYFLRVYGDIGQIVPMVASSDDPASIDAVIRGCEAVVFLPGVLHARGARGFERVHKLYPALVADACARNGVKRLVHISALACDFGQSKYAQSKRAGEQSVMAAFPDATVLRPSIVFGPEDGFFGRFAKMAKILPALPLIGGGHTKFQPVFVGDVAAATLAAISLPSSGAHNPLGRIYELGGPDILSFKDLLKKMFAHTGRPRPLLPLPFTVARLQGAIMQNLPGAILTSDQVVSLKTDNIVRGNYTLADLGITPVSLEAILPHSMARHREGSLASKGKKAA